MAVGSVLIRIEMRGQRPPALPRPRPRRAARPCRRLPRRGTPARRRPRPICRRRRPLPRRSHAHRAPRADPTRRPTAGSAFARAAPSLAAPAVRARARALGIELSQLKGSGPAGRIVHADLDAAAARTRAGVHAPSPRCGRADEGRRGQARRPAPRSRRRCRSPSARIPHFTYVEEVDVTEMMALRAQLNRQYGFGAATLAAGLHRAHGARGGRVPAGQRPLRRRGRRADAARRRAPGRGHADRRSA
jgi:2-oxoisovalerate dehydrogenase E2 component (dihydrolipoyl transacylase)